MYEHVFTFSILTLFGHSYQFQIFDKTILYISEHSRVSTVFNHPFLVTGGEVYPNAISGRVLVGFWWLFTIIISATYTANLAAFLTVTIINNPINSLEQLAASTTVFPLILEGTNLETHFKVRSNICNSIQMIRICYRI